MEQQFVVSDLTFQSFNEDNNIMVEEGVKSEEIKDEDILLFSQLDQLTNNLTSPNNFQIIQELEVSSTQPSSSYSLPSFSATEEHLQEDFSNRLPVDLSGICKVEGIKNENSSHFVKYKFQDGKHVKIWECGICAKEFGHQYTLMRHLPTHTDERKFQCNTCGKGNLRNHIFTHTNERPYKCDICEKGFNQMSNLMCHKMKAHQRADKPKYLCRICGLDFPKRMGLRSHEQFEHGLNNQPIDPSGPSDDLSKMSSLIVEPIKTEAMRLALESNQTPFALLRPLTGIPVLVRVVPAGDKQMLVPATAEDLKKYGHISITPKVMDGDEDQEADKENKGPDTEKPLGSTVQIKVPVVATVIQKGGLGGHMSMSVLSPPNNKVNNDSNEEQPMTNGNFVFTSTLTQNNVQDEVIVSEENFTMPSYVAPQMVTSASSNMLNNVSNKGFENQTSFVYTGSGSESLSVNAGEGLEEQPFQKVTAEHTTDELLSLSGDIPVQDEIIIDDDEIQFVML